MRTVFKALTKAMRIIFYPLHFGFRILTRLLFLFGILIAVPLLPCLFILGTDWTSVLSKTTKFILDAGIPFTDRTLDNLIPISERTLDTYMPIGSSLGVLQVILAQSKDALINSLAAIKDRVVEFILDLKGWIPGLVVKDSLGISWKESLAKTLPSAWHVFKSSSMLIVTVSLVLIIGVLSSKPEESIKNEIDINISKYDKKMVVLQENINLLGSTINQLKSVVLDSYTFDVNPVFFLAHTSNGNLHNKEGICPGVKPKNTEDTNEDLNLKWLRMFKQAVLACSSECSKKGSRVQLEVRAFASIAPVYKDGSDESSDFLNCEIANQRAEAVVDFLISESDSDWPSRCKEVVGGSKWKEVSSEPCKGRKRKYTYGIDDGLAFDLVYIPWQSHDAMTDGRPLNDGSLEWRWHKAEFLNRAVHIVVKNDACWREGWLRLNRVQPEVDGSDSDETGDVPK